jgi:YidC/Oxa1 family membrane protein insertase
MSLLAGIFGFTAIGNAIGWVLAAFYAIIPNYGVAIILLSVIWMALIAPLTLKQTRSMLAMQQLQPKIKQLQEQYKHDRQALSQATMDLYKQEGVNPLGGCLPAILPLPIFIVLFRVIDGLSTLSKTGVPTPKYLNVHTRMYRDLVAAHGHINAFGMNLAKSGIYALEHAGAVGMSVGAVFAYVFLLLFMIGAQYYQQVMLMNRNPAARNNPQMQLMKFFPVIFGVLCIRFPAGVVLYYTVSALCRVAQQWAMYRFDPKVKALVSYDVGVIEARADEIEGRPQAKPRLRDMFNIPSLPPAQGAGSNDGVVPGNKSKPGFTPPRVKPQPAPENGKGTKPVRGRNSGGYGGGTTNRKAQTNGSGGAKVPPATNGTGRTAPPNGGAAASNRSNRKRRGR